MIAIFENAFYIKKRDIFAIWRSEQFPIGFHRYGKTLRGKRREFSFDGFFSEMPFRNKENQSDCHRACNNTATNEYCFSFVHFYEFICSCFILIFYKYLPCFTRC